MRVAGRNPRLNGGRVHMFEIHNPERQSYLAKIAPAILLTVAHATTVAPDVTPAAK